MSVTLTSANKKMPPTNGPSAKQLKMRITINDPLYKGLKKIKLTGKELSNLPLSLFQLSELQVLDLSPEREACLFYHVTQLPVQIGNLSNLTALAIDTNKLTSLPEEICKLSSLERLAISNNHLSYLPAAFPRLSNLQSLCCSNNKFEELPRSVCQLKSLTFLDFSGNSISCMPDGRLLYLRIIPSKYMLAQHHLQSNVECRSTNERTFMIE